ncbi:MAG TPA: peptidoglycan DD-metalloendopeptidase family protein [Acidimicrobiales bacterium]|nr:peptidoglycan DD-metalloendopeptidase family protein [Acidimicrobiales bacterium]
MKRLAAVAVLAVAVAGLVSAGTPASAVSRRAQKAAVEARIRAVTSQLDEVEAAEAGLQARVDQALAAKAALDSRVGALDAQLSAVTRSLAAAEAMVASATGRVGATLAELGAVRAQQEDARRRLSADAVQAYIGQPATGLAALILDTRTLVQAQALSGYLDAVVTLHSSDLQRYQLLHQRTAALAATQQAERQKAQAGRDAVAERRARLDVTRASLTAAVAARAAQAATLQGLYAEAARQRADLQAQLAALQAQSDRIASLLRSEQRNQVPLAVGGGMLSPPIPGAPITSPFGMRYDPVLHQWMLHSGVDFGAPYGTAIHAAASGVVVAAGWMGGYGQATVIDHGGSLATLYGHQEQILVAVGERVGRGQVIGLVGCTGWCTGPHVHFEVRVNGTPVNPLPYL